MAGGRPEDYKPEYCEMLIEHMESGLSFESFAGAVDVTRKTVYNWCESHPEFLHAKEKGRAKGMIHDEKILNGITIGAFPKGNIAGIIFKLKCKYRDDWRDQEGPSQATPITINYVKDASKPS